MVSESKRDAGLVRPFHQSSLSMPHSFFRFHLIPTSLTFYYAGICSTHYSKGILSVIKCPGLTCPCVWTVLIKDHTQYNHLHSFNFSTLKSGHSVCACEFYACMKRDNVFFSFPWYMYMTGSIVSLKQPLFSLLMTERLTLSAHYTNEPETPDGPESTSCINK